MGDLGDGEPSSRVNLLHCRLLHLALIRAVSKLIAIISCRALSAPKRFDAQGRGRGKRMVPGLALLCVSCSTEQDGTKDEVR